MKLTFENQICTRCGGTGKYSFNMTHKDICYGCGGKGKQLSPKGKKAREVFDAVMQIMVCDLIVGDVVKMNNLTGKKNQTILDIKPDDQNENMVVLTFADSYYYHVGNESWVTLGFEPQYHNRVLAVFEGVEGVTIT